MSSSDWIALAALVVSGASFAAPWLRNHWLERKGRVRAFPVGKVEVGFSAIGHTVAIEGSLRSEDCGFFLHSAELVVTHESGTRNQLLWAGLRPRKVLASLNQPDLSVVSPVGFELKQRASQYYHVLFTHSESSAGIYSILSPLRGELFDRMREAGIVAWHDPISQTQVREFEGRFLNDLANSGRFAASVRSLDDLCFWKIGKYSLTLKLFTADPARTFSETWDFRLSEEEVQRLRGNASILMFQNVGQLSMQLAFVEVPYLTPADMRGAQPPSVQRTLRSYARR